MTDDRMAFMELIGKTPAKDFFLEMITVIANRLMELEVESRCNTVPSCLPYWQSGALLLRPAGALLLRP